MSAPKYGFTVQDILNDGRITKEAIESLKPWLKEQNLSTLSDEQIVIFLLRYKNNQEAVKKLTKAYFYGRNKMHEVFTDRKVSHESFQIFLKLGEMCVMPKRTADNCIIYVSRLSDSNYKNSEMAPFCKAMSMMLDAALYDNPPSSAIFIFDMEGLGMMHITKIKFKLLKALVIYIQEGSPTEIKNIYFLNCNHLIDKIISLVKHIISSEFLQKIKFYPKGFDLDNFYKEALPRELLPENYGGLLPIVRILHEENIKRLEELEEFFEAEERQRATIKIIK